MTLSRITDLPVQLRHGRYSDPYFVEYVRRSLPYTMEGHHFHPYYEMYCLLSGSRNYFVEDATYAVKAGDLVFIGKNVLHQTLLAAEPLHERIVMHIDDRFVRDALGNHAELLLSPFAQPTPVVRLRGEDRERLYSLTARILEELLEKSPGYELAFKQAIAELLYLHPVPYKRAIRRSYPTSLLCIAKCRRSCATSTRTTQRRSGSESWQSASTSARTT